MSQIFHGAITGMLFGFLLQRGGIFRYEKQLGVLRLIDMTVIKFMLSAVLTAMVGIYALNGFGLVELHIAPAILGANIIGGLIFGTGWALLGYCPATQLGALGEGRFDAVWGILGMIAGGILYAESYPFLEKTIFTWGVLGRITLPKLLSVSPWIIIPILIYIAKDVFRWMERNDL